MMKSFSRIKNPRGEADKSAWTGILPPETTMSTYSPMGWIPGTRTHGYAASLVSSSTSGDVYQFKTEVWLTIYLFSGQQVATYSNPLFWVQKFYTPNSYVFKYQYSEISW